MSEKMALYLIGAGGFCTEVLSVFRDDLDLRFGSDCVFVVDPNFNATHIFNRPIIAEVVREDIKQRDKFCVAISNNEIRKKLAYKYAKLGLAAETLISEKSEIYLNSSINVGSIVLDHCIVSANTAVGCYSIINSQCYIGHDCSIGSFVTLSPKSNICGNVIIGDGVFVGAGAIIKNGSKLKPLTIGANAIIGMGAVVLDDVPPNAKVVGNPARQIN